VQVTDKQELEVSQTTSTAGGGQLTSTASVKGSEASASIRVEQPGRGSVEGGVTVSDETVGVQGSLTNAAGETYNGSFGVAPNGDSFTLGAGRKDHGVSRGGELTISADGISGSVTGGLQLPGGLSFEFKVSGSHATETQSEGGFTTTTTEGEVSLRAGGRLAAGRASVGRSYTEGLQTSFETRLPDADAARVEAGEAPQPNPYDPATIPEGGSILMRDQEFNATTGTVGFHGIEAGGSQREEQTESLLVERTGPDTVRVTVGPEQALEDSFRLGYSVGPLSAGVSSTDRLEVSAHQRAEFDLSTEEGRAAYDEALATRSLPRENGAGVSGVEEIQRAQVEFGAELSASLGPWSARASGTTLAERTFTTRPDGSQDQTTHLDSATSVPITLQQSFGPDGSEDLSQQQLTLNLADLEPDAAARLQRAITGERVGVERGPQDVTLTLTPDHLRQLQEQAQARIDREGSNFNEFHPPSNRTLQGITMAENLEDLAYVLHEHSGDDTVADLLQGINATAGGQLPGTVTARPSE
jgi:hypothetical protein